jgi:dephospho-CoA kinase
VRLIGITGGIGSGKTTVARMLADRGGVVIDADELARRAIDPGTPGHAKAVERFGPGVVASDGSIDRERLARIVFDDPSARRDLEAIIHPEVARLFAEATLPYRDTDAVVVYDVPLLVEAGLEGMFDAVVVVAAPQEVRMGRLVARGMSEEDARSRMGSQASDQARGRAASVVLRNDGGLDDLRRAVDELWATLSAG